MLRNGRVLFTTLIPDTDPCAYGGRSWLMEFSELTGSRLAYSPFDLNSDKSFDSNDYVNDGTTEVPVTGISNDAIMSRPSVIGGEKTDYAIITDTGGGLGGPNLNPGPGAIGRQSWRQLR